MAANNLTQPATAVCGQASNSTGGDFDRQSWIISVSLAVFAAFINNFGLNLQKLAWTKKQSNIIHSWNYRMLWIVGMVFIILASVFDFVALAFGPQSVIAPLGSLTMVSNALVAPWMHKEKLHPHVLWSTLIIMTGCVLSVASASHANEVCDIDSLFALYWTMRFVLYALILVAIIVSVMLFIRRAEDIVRTLGSDSEQYQKVFKYHRISYAFLSGLLGAQSVLFARSVDLLFVGSTRGGRIFLAYPGTYMIVFCLVSCIFLQIYWLNQGLARFESLYNVPIFTSTWIVGTVLGGGVFYGEFAQFSVAQALLFPMGIFMCVLGVLYLSFGSAEVGANIIDASDARHGRGGAKRKSARVGVDDDLENAGFEEEDEEDEDDDEEAMGNGRGMDGTFSHDGGGDIGGGRRGGSKGRTEHSPTPRGHGETSSAGGIPGSSQRSGSTSSSARSSANSKIVLNPGFITSSLSSSATGASTGAELSAGRDDPSAPLTQHQVNIGAAGRRAGADSLDDILGSNSNGLTRI